MPQIGTLWVTLVVNAEQFTRGLQEAAAAIQKQARSLTAIGSAMTRSVSLPLALAGGAAVKMAGDLEQTQLAFTTLLGSAKAAGDYMGQLHDFASRTPFQFTDLTEQARRLMAFGFAAQDVVPMLSAVGDAVSAMGGGAEALDRVTYALGQMHAAGKLNAQDMMQITSTGIPAWDYLAQAMGKSQAQVMDLTSKGLIPANVAIRALLKGMHQQFGGLMEQQAKTLEGSLSNFVDELTWSGITIGQTIVQTLNLTQRIRELTAWVQRAANAFAALPGPVKETAVWLGVTAAVAGPLLYTTGVMARGAMAVASGLGAMLRFVRGLAAAFVLWRTTSTSLLGALASVFGKLGLWGIIAGVVAGAAILIATHWRQTVAVVKAAWAAMSAAALVYGSLWVRGVGLILEAIAFIIPPLRGTADAVMGVANRMVDGARAAIASAGATLRAGFAAAQQSDQLNRAIAGQQGVAKSAQQAAQGQQDLAKATQDAAKAASDNIQSFDQVHQIQGAMASSANDLASSMPDVSMPELDVSGLGGGLSGGLLDLGKQMSDSLSGVKSAWDNFVNWLSSKWDWITTTGKNLWGDFTNWLHDTTSNITTWVSDRWNDLGNWLQTTWTNLQAWGQTTWSNLSNAISQAAGNASMWVQQRWGDLSNWLSTTWGNLSAWAGPTWANITNTVGTWTDQARNWVAGRWTDAVTTAQNLWGQLQAYAGPAWSGMTTTIGGLVDQAKASISGAWTDATTTTSNLWTKLQAQAGPVWESIRTSAEGPVSTAKGAIVNAWDWVSQRLADVWSGIRDTAERIWNGIIDAVKKPINAVIAAVNGFLDRLASIRVTIPVVNLGPLGTWGGGVIGFPRIPPIPYLAEGGIVTSPTLAVVGEAGPEAVVPLSRDNALADSIAQAVYQAVRDALRVSQVGSSPSAGDREIVLRIDGRTFARAVLPAVIAEGQRQGLQLVVRPAGA